MIRALDRKLLRDLWQVKGQAIAIALVMAAGVAVFVMYLSTFHSLGLTLESYYERQRFADVFATAKRAPRSLAARLALVPGVAQVETRVVADVSLDVAELSEPASARLISLPDRQSLNSVFLRRGRMVDPERPDEVLVTEGFALKRGLGPGDSLAAVINGRRRELEIVGVGLSPEFVYVIRPGEFLPDESRFGVFWMGRKALASAFNMEGGFNDVVIKLMRDASSAEVIARVDELLEPYGGTGAIPRTQQISHWYLRNELTQLETMGYLMPLVFLGVAGFLVNVVLNRIVAVQREQIAAIKAQGYSNRELALHYTKWALAVAVVGVGLGTAGGAWLGAGLTRLYSEWFRFPVLSYELTARVVLGALAVSFVAAALGALGAVRRAVALPPAEAMRPEPPASFKQSWLERAGLGKYLATPTRMILRNIQRQPGRTLISIVGIAFAVAIMIVGSFFMDAMDEMMDVQFNVAQRQDITLSFVEPRSAKAIYELGRLPGVLQVEPLRAVPARLRFGHRSRQVAIMGLGPRPSLNRVIDVSLRPVELTPGGLVLSSKLAELLGVRRGELVTVEILEAARPVRQLRVVDLVEEYMGTSAYMEIEALQRFMHEGGNLSGAFVLVDEHHADELYDRFKKIPAVAGVNLKRAMIQSFEESVAQNMDVMIFFNLLFSSVIAFGVVYNAARISLSERSRELASLRVLGFTRAEISAILLGELAIVTLCAVPLGLVLGYYMAAGIVVGFDTELYRIPLVISTRTYAASALTVLVAAIISGLVVRRKLDGSDLIAVLKTRE